MAHLDQDLAGTQAGEPVGARRVRQDVAEHTHRSSLHRLPRGVEHPPFQRGPGVRQNEFDLARVPAGFSPHPGDLGKGVHHTDLEPSGLQLVEVEPARVIRDLELILRVTSAVGNDLIVAPARELGVDLHARSRASLRVEHATGDPRCAAQPQLDRSLNVSLQEMDRLDPAGRARGEIGPAGQTAAEDRERSIRAGHHRGGRVDLPTPDGPQPDLDAGQRHALLVDDAPGEDRRLRGRHG
jgi:hypothetical protein